MSDEASVLIKSSQGEVSIFIDGENNDEFDESSSLLSNQKSQMTSSKKLKRKKGFIKKSNIFSPS